MTRILYSTDQHVSRRAPKSRQDDFFETILGKIQWETDFGNRMGVDLFLNGGDLWDKPTQSVYELNRIYDVWHGRKAPTKGVVGNHPISGNAELWHDRSGLLIMEREGLIEILDPFKADIEVDGRFFRLHHTDLLRRPVKHWKHILWEDYDPEGVDVVLISHYHPRQGYHIVNGVHFISPGAVSRGTLAEDNLKRKPACTLITIEKGKIDFKHVIIPHEPGPDVLDDNTVLTIEDVIEDDESLDECVESMREMEGEGTLLTNFDILRMVNEGMHISDEAYELVVEKMKGIEE